MQISDIERCLKQFRKHEQLNYLILSPLLKIILGITFFILLPFTLFELFKKRAMDKKSIYIIDYDDNEPFRSIKFSIKEVKGFTFIPIKRNYIPRLPSIFLKDVWLILMTKPIFLIKNLDFFGALAWKISKYYALICKYNIHHLIVFQEYSFYSSYLTRVLELDGGKLFNIQHGIPGKTYSYFRFSKMFIWGEYFKEVYIENGADKNQFIITGSIVHSSIKNKLTRDDYIDILYIMQGNQDEMDDVFHTLEKLSEKYIVKYIQHPRHFVQVNTKLQECNLDIWSAIIQSKRVVGHFSTALLDARWLGKRVIAYPKKDIQEYVSYLSKENIVYNKEDLLKALTKPLTKESTLDTYCIATEDNPVIKIKEEINKCIQ